MKFDAEKSLQVLNKDFQYLKMKLKTHRIILKQGIFLSDHFDYYHSQTSEVKTVDVGNFVSLDQDDHFIHFFRKKHRQEGQQTGDKFHISVDVQQIESAFDVIASLLCLEQSPFDEWKVTSLKSVQRWPEERVVMGMQFACYVRPRKENSLYVLEDFIELKDMIASIECALKEVKIKPGKIDLSDVQATHWCYVSYRNENRSDRSEQNNQLIEEPFFKLLCD
jgi:phosphothreonine lyase